MASAVQRAYAASLLGEPLHSTACVNGAAPVLAELDRPLGAVFSTCFRIQRNPVDWDVRMLWGPRPSEKK
eukprot:9647649-Alexandrium_andersonii.AAC.1